MRLTECLEVVCLKMIFLELILELFRVKKCWEVLEHVIMNSLLLVVNNITVILTCIQLKVVTHSRTYKNIYESVLRWLILINLIVHMEWYYGENLWFLFIVQDENRDYLISDWIMTMGLTQDWVLELFECSRIWWTWEKTFSIWKFRNLT